MGGRAALGGLSGVCDPLAYAADKPLTFHAATSRFSDGGDSRLASLERCLETVAEREPRG